MRRPARLGRAPPRARARGAPRPRGRRGPPGHGGHRSLDRVGAPSRATRSRSPSARAGSGRVWNGMGEPLDGGPPMLGGDRRPVAGAPLNPTARDVPEDPILTGHLGHRRADDARARPEAPDLLESPGFRTSSSRPRSPRRRTSADEPFKVVVVAMGLTHADAATMRDALETAAPRGDLALFLDTRRRPRRPAGARATRRAHASPSTSPSTSASTSSSCSPT